MEEKPDEKNILLAIFIAQFGLVIVFSSDASQ